MSGKIHQIATHALNPYEKTFLSTFWNRLISFFGFRRTVSIIVNGISKPRFIKITDLKPVIEKRRVINLWKKTSNAKKTTEHIQNYNIERTIESIDLLAPCIINNSNKKNLCDAAKNIGFLNLRKLFTLKEFRPRKLVPALVAIGANLNSPQRKSAYEEKASLKKYGFQISPDGVVLTKRTEEQLICLNLTTFVSAKTPIREESIFGAAPLKDKDRYESLISAAASQDRLMESSYLPQLLDIAAKKGFKDDQLRSIISVCQNVDSKKLLLLVRKVDENVREQLLNTYVKIGEHLSSKNTKVYIEKDELKTHFAYAMKDKDIFINTNNYNACGGFKKITGGYHLNHLKEIVRVKALKKDNRSARSEGKSTWKKSKFSYEEAAKNLSQELKNQTDAHATNNPDLMDLPLLVVEEKDKNNNPSVVFFQTKYPSTVKFLTDLEFFQLLSSFTDMAKGLARMHEHDFIHCDVKPSNFLISGDFEGDDPVKAKIADLGAMQKTDEALRFKTVYYLAPEASVKATATKQLDAFALGVSFLEGLVGRRKILEPQLKQPHAKEKEPVPSELRKTLGSITEDEKSKEIQRIRKMIENDRKKFTEKELEVRLNIVDIAKELLETNVQKRMTCAAAALKLEPLKVILEEHSHLSDL